MPKRFPLLLSMALSTMFLAVLVLPGVVFAQSAEYTGCLTKSGKVIKMASGDLPFTPCGEGQTQITLYSDSGCGDLDRDGYQAPEDCDDNNPEVNPEADFHETPLYDGNWDWNCDSRVEKEHLTESDVSQLDEADCEGEYIIWAAAECGGFTCYRGPCGVTWDTTGHVCHLNKCLLEACIPTQVLRCR